PLIAIEGLVKVAVSRPEKLRPDGTPNISAIMKILDLDHLGAEIGKVLGTKGSCTILLDRDDPHAGERQAHTRFLSISCLAMIMRWISWVPSQIIRSGASLYSRSMLNSLE